ncbi:MAG: hypothetical protein WEB58_20935 [Planctomycetaceae bacterium]
MSNSNGSSGRNLATYVALMGMVGIGLGFLFLVALIVPGLVKMVFIPIVFAFFLALHYVTWGRSMMRQKALYDAQQAEPGSNPRLRPDELDG